MGKTAYWLVRRLSKCLFQKSWLLKCRLKTHNLFVPRGGFLEPLLFGIGTAPLDQRALNTARLINSSFCDGHSSCEILPTKGGCSMPRTTKNTCVYTPRLNAFFEEALLELDNVSRSKTGWPIDADASGAAPHVGAIGQNLDIHTVAALLRVCAAFPDNEKALVEGLCGAFCFTVIETENADWIEPVENAIESGLLPAVRKVSAHLPKVSVLAPSSRGYSRNPQKQRMDFENALKASIATSRPIVCVVEQAEQLSAPISTAVTQVVRLAGLSKGLFLKLHKVMHGPSCPSDVDEAFTRLPAPEELQRLSLDEVTICARQRTLQTLVLALADVTNQSSSEWNPDALNAVKGLVKERALLEQLTKDVRSWANGQVCWKEMRDSFSSRIFVYALSNVRKDRGSVSGTAICQCTFAPSYLPLAL